MNRKIVLASNSPRRKELLRQIGLEFTADPADLDESALPDERPGDYAVRVAREKAAVASKRSRDAIVIAADTIVVLDGMILGKPADIADAERMLGLLSGRMHEVATGLVVRDSSTGRTAEGLSVTRVWFRDMSSEEISAYAATREPMDKAGAYGIQEKGAVFIDRIEGCYFNVVGLPISMLYIMLKGFGIDPLLKKG